MALVSPLRRASLRLIRHPPLPLETHPLGFPAIHSYFHSRALYALRQSSRNLHVSARRQADRDSHGSRTFANGGGHKPAQDPEKPPTPPPPIKHPGHAQDYIPLIRRLLPHLPTPHNPLHRPTKEELLAAATSFWQRLRIRFKWFSIRGWRRFNADDLSAFLSWFLVGNSKHGPFALSECALTKSAALWVVLGTWVPLNHAFVSSNLSGLQNNIHFRHFCDFEFTFSAELCRKTPIRLPYAKHGIHCSVSTAHLMSPRMLKPSVS